MENIFFGGWESVARTLIIGVLAYIGLIIQLRIAGKRTLSKMNAFDFIVSVALGSTLASALLTKSVTLVDGLLAFAILIFLQFVITWSSVRSSKFSSLVKATPALLFYQGEFLWSAMKSERVTREEILAAVREKGAGTLSDVDAVILETEGKLSIIRKTKSSSDTLLQNVKKPPQAS